MAQYFGLTKQIKVRDRHVRQLLDASPRIYFACHTRPVKDPATGGDVSAHQASILDHQGFQKATRTESVREAKSVLDPVRVEQVLGQLSPADRESALKGLDLLARASEKHMKATLGVASRGSLVRSR